MHVSVKYIIIMVMSYDRHWLHIVQPVEKFPCALTAILHHRRPFIVSHLSRLRKLDRANRHKEKQRNQPKSGEWQPKSKCQVKTWLCQLKFNISHRATRSQANSGDHRDKGATTDRLHLHSLQLSFCCYPLPYCKCTCNITSLSSGSPQLAH